MFIFFIILIEILLSCVFVLISNYHEFQRDLAKSMRGRGDQVPYEEVSFFRWLQTRVINFCRKKSWRKSL